MCRKGLNAGDLLAKDLSRKFFDARLLRSPRAWRKSGFHARLVEEGLPVPSIFSGDLRQKKAGGTSTADDQAVAAGLDFFNVAHFFNRAHHGDLQLELLHLVRSHRHE